MAHSHHDSGKPWKRLGDGSLLTEDADEGLGHILDLSVLNKVFVALLFLTVITVWASRIDFGQMNVVIAITIASVKALMVALFFMHLKFEGKAIIMYAIYPLVLLVLLIGGSFVDVAERYHIVPMGAEPLEDKQKPTIIHGNDARSADHSSSH